MCHGIRNQGYLINFLSPCFIWHFFYPVLTKYFNALQNNIFFSHVLLHSMQTIEMKMKLQNLRTSKCEGLQLDTRLRSSELSADTTGPKNSLAMFQWTVCGSGSLSILLASSCPKFQHWGSVSSPCQRKLTIPTLCPSAKMKETKGNKWRKWRGKCTSFNIKKGASQRSLPRWKRKRSA